MITETASSTKAPFYIPDLFHYRRRKTRVVRVGDVGVGGDHPIRVQSMTTTPTTDVQATVSQTISLVKSGCEIVRITAPTLADARALGEIKKSLLAQGITVPLVADIHFNPECAMEAANYVEKVRVNPGNYADSKIFKVKEYTGSEYEAELQRLEERFTPLALKCRSLGRAMRIGSNHGSLSDRIMNRYGDSPEGMVESALEFVRICEKNQFYEIILSMKSSNPKVTIAAYRLLAARMEEEGMDYPFHLGVTEAGYGEDGRIKSAIGIGSLLNDGIGDTIRVSLTEDPEYEVPVAFQIAAPYQPSDVIPSPLAGEGARRADEGVQKGKPPLTLHPLPRGEREVYGQVESDISLSHVDNFYHYARRKTRELRVGPFKMGGENTVRVFNDFSEWLQGEKDPKSAALKLLRLLEEQLSSGKDMIPEIMDWPIHTEEDLKKLQACRTALGGETSRLAFLGRFFDLTLVLKGLNQVHLALFSPNGLLSKEKYFDRFGEFIRAAKAAGVPVLLEAAPSPPPPPPPPPSPTWGRGSSLEDLPAFSSPSPLVGEGGGEGALFEPANHLLQLVELSEKEGYADLLLSFNLPTVSDLIANVRLAVALLREKGKDYPVHLRFPSLVHPSPLVGEGGRRPDEGLPLDLDEQRIQMSIAFGSLLCDGIGDSVQGGLGIHPKQDLELIYNVLQGAGVRITKTEYVSCPSCGRTLFDLQSTTERIKNQTGHLKGVKIAIMGCIVNGPGEMADADFGYVGGAPGKINLYVGKNCVEKGIPASEADQRLIHLIKSHGKWVDSK